MLIYRDSLPQLSYSVEEIYGMRISRASQKYVSTKKVYNEMYSLYNLEFGRNISPDVIITEDSNSENEMNNEIILVRR